MPQDPTNPYLNQSPMSSSILHAQEERTIILNPDGTADLVGLVEDRIEVNPVTGERRLIRTKKLIRSDDGRLIQNPESMTLYACSSCRRKLLTEHSIKYCQDCQRVVCLDCVGIIVEKTTNQPNYYCAKCYWRQRSLWRRLLHRLSGK